MILAKELTEEFSDFITNYYGLQVETYEADTAKSTGEYLRFMFGERIVVVREHAGTSHLVEGKGVTLEVHYTGDPDKLKSIEVQWAHYLNNLMKKAEGDSDVDD